MNRSTIVFSAVIAICLLAAWFLWTGPSKNEQRRRGGDGAIPVAVVSTDTATLTGRRWFTGTVEPVAQTTIAARLAGRVEAMLVDIGDQVENGALVARLDAAEARQDLAEAEASLLVAQAGLLEAVANRDQEQRNVERLRRLRERSVAAEAELEIAESRLAVAVAGVSTAEARIAEREAVVAARRLRTAYALVAATWTDRDDAGMRIVAERLVEPGDYVGVGDALIRIVAVDPVLAVIQVTEGDYASLRLGQAAEVQVPGAPIMPGTIRRIAPAFDGRTRQAQVEIELANPEARLAPGMFVRVGVITGVAPDATVIPAQALVRRDGGEGCWVVRNDAAHWVPLAVLVEEDGRLAITGALEADDSVVTVGQHLLSDGAAIKVAAIGGITQ